MINYDGQHVHGRELDLTNLSKLIRDAADPDYWLSEVERVASSLGFEDYETREIAWLAVNESIDSILILAFDYRHRSGHFLPVLKQWFVDQKAKWHLTNDVLHTNSYSEMPAEVLAHTVHSKLLSRIESVYEHHQAEINGAQVFELIDPPTLAPAEVHYASEVASLLRKSIGKIKALQKEIEPSPYEFDIYRTILESAAKHFEAMSPRDKAA